jgi:hypothetical protein
MADSEYRDSGPELWIGLALAAPGLACLFGLMLNAVVAEPKLATGALVEGLVTTGVFGGGLLSLLTTPALFFYILAVQRRVSPAVRGWLFALFFISLFAVILVVRYLVGLSDLS